MDIKLQAIGTIHTPYLAINAPDQPLKDAPGDFWLALKPEYTSALQDLDSFNYIFVLYYLDQAVPSAEPLVNPPWSPETEIGLFAGRSAQRPNPIGLSVVQVKEISGNEVTISAIDAYNGTPLLDIKPYFPFLDRKEDAHNGWLDALPDKEHIIAHVRGLDHSHDHDHSHNHGHDHNHDHHPNHDDHRDHDHDHSHSHSHSHNPKLTPDRLPDHDHKHK